MFSFADEHRWNTASSGDWSTSGNWHLGVVPGAGDVVRISQGTVRGDIPHLVDGYQVWWDGKAFHRIDSDVILEGTGTLKDGGLISDRLLAIGTQVGGVARTFTQTGGSLDVQHFALSTTLGEDQSALANQGSRLGNSAHYTMTGGTFQAETVHLGLGAKATGILSITVPGAGNTLTADTLNVGMSGGLGELHLHEGNLQTTSFVVGSGKMEGATAVISRGIVNYHSGTHTSDEMILGDHLSATNYVNLHDSASLVVHNFLYIGQGNASTIFTQTGGSVVVAPVAGAASSTGLHGVFLGKDANFDGYMNSNNTASYQMSGGTFDTAYDTYIGYMPGEDQKSWNSFHHATWSISGGAAVNIRTDSNAPYPSGVTSGGNLHIGYNELPPEVYTYPNFQSSTMAVHDGTLNVEGSVIGYSSNSWFDVYGAEGDIRVGGDFGAKSNVNPLQDPDPRQEINVRGIFGADGISTIHVGGTAYMKNPVMVELTGPPNATRAMTMVNLKADTIDIIKASRIDTTLSGAQLVNDLSPVNFNAEVVTEGVNDILRLTVPDDVPVWDMTNSWTFNGTEGLKTGILRLEGDQPDKLSMILRYDAHPTTTGETLVNYLQSVTADSGLAFSALSDNEILIRGNLINSDGYGYLVWDFTGYSKIGTFYLIQLNAENNVPEPATWAMMLLGGLAILMMRKRRKV